MPTIKPERELVEVVVQVIVTDRTLMRAKNPALQQRIALCDTLTFSVIPRYAPRPAGFCSSAKHLELLPSHPLSFSYEPLCSRRRLLRVFVPTA